jgi:membrane protein implicated in regulation of membrane protease activity
VTALAPAAGVVAANPGPAVHLAAIAIVLLVGLATYGVVRWRRRRDHSDPESQPEARDHTSAHPPSKTPRP